MNNNLYDLTNPQKSIWETEQFYKGMSIENITGCAIISQKVNFDSLKEAINLLVKKNESFRLKFILKDGIVKQYVDFYKEFDIETVLVSSDNDVKNLERQMCDTPFETLENFLFNFKMFKFKDGHGGFILNIHHLISDAWTMGLVVNEVIDFYNSIINNIEISNELNPSYIEYIESENEYLNSNKFEKDKLFWNEMFSTIPEIATIPTFVSDNKISRNSKRKQFTIPKETISLINDFCKKNKASIFNFFMGVFSLYLSRVSGLNEFVIGTPILNRSNFKEKQTTGMFISTIPFKISIDNDKTFENFITNISRNFLQIYRHQKYPYQYLLEDLRKTDNTIPSLYKFAVSYQNARNNKQSSSIPYETRWVSNSNIADDINIHLYDINDTGNVTVAYDYLADKYSIDDICYLHTRILHIINQIIGNNNIHLKNIEIVTPEERHKILYKFNNTKSSYPRYKTITQIFENQVEINPNKPAIIFDSSQLTYEELNQKSNQLARYMQEIGVKSHDKVVILADKSIDMYISIIAILKLGAMYVPVDTEYPKERIELIIDDCKPKLLIVDNKYQSMVQGKNICTIPFNNLEKYENTNIENSITARRRGIYNIYIRFYRKT